ncbi:ABC transporter substrate-binding protein, partial [Salmonella enterica subsp. enterica serovar Muenchen]|nr:ABC transporter substrate-binding protein [Salmonella enterica]ECD3025380.1 ABC transporter substrate-binding protein [Salmonella enterica subsp. enterica serovar Braenderup]EDI0662664.1 ABC transporter substrate-binding protein [Salmonella enterica subsp. enterica serovar Muenchen]
MLRREKQKQRIIWDKLMIKGKLALVTCALTLVFTSSLFAASDTADGRTLKLAIG